MSERARQLWPVALVIVAVAAVTWRLMSGGDDPALNSANINRRLVAMETLAADNSDSARAKLRELSADEDPRIVLQSIRGMGVNRDEANRRHLETFIAEAKQPAYRREAIASLAHYEEVNVTKFTAILATDRDAEARAGAAQALARRAEKATIPAMYKALNDPDPEVRVWAITGIKNVTFTGFTYDPALPPSQQRDVINQIGTWLKQNRYM